MKVYTEVGDDSVTMGFKYLTATPGTANRLYATDMDHKNLNDTVQVHWKEAMRDLSCTSKVKIELLTIILRGNLLQICRLLANNGNKSQIGIDDDTGNIPNSGKEDMFQHTYGLYAPICTESLSLSSTCRAVNSGNPKILESLLTEVLFASENAAKNEKTSKVDVTKSRCEAGRLGASFSDNALSG
jgi:hypothetical protein